MKNIKKLLAVGLFTLVPVAGFGMEPEGPVMVDVSAQTDEFVLNEKEIFFCKTIIMQNILEKMLGSIKKEQKLCPLNVMGKGYFKLKKAVKKGQIFQSARLRDMDFSFLFSGEYRPSVDKKLRKIVKLYRREVRGQRDEGSTDDFAPWDAGFSVDSVAERICELVNVVFYVISSKRPDEIEKFYVRSLLGMSKKVSRRGPLNVVVNPFMSITGIFRSSHALVEICKSMIMECREPLAERYRDSFVAGRLTSLVENYRRSIRDGVPFLELGELRSSEEALLRAMPPEAWGKTIEYVEAVLADYGDWRFGSENDFDVLPSLKCCLESLGFEGEKDGSEMRALGSEESEDEDEFEGEGDEAESKLEELPDMPDFDSDSDESDTEFFDCKD